MTAQEVPHDTVACEALFGAQALLGETLFEVPDAHADAHADAQAGVPRADKPLVVGQPRCHADTRAFTLLYIEDEPLNALLVKEALHNHPDWQVLHAADGRAGLALARTQRPEVVITDINLPGLSGLDVVRELRADAALGGTLCIALSADATPGQIELATQAGFDNYWTKPLDVLELAGRLADALEQHGGR